ncbi:MAG: pyridoxamine 5'-phosphate oxidase family protein, partial [Clostridia bacterium]|nr:pyridoxamine 5'-phosphate oxidase family protein [Clostridia bacterium]
ATVEADQPRVRPFGAVCEFEDKLYVVTNNEKKVYAQIMENPKVEISGMSGDSWIRLEGELKRDNRIEARQAMLAANEATLGKLYHADDHKMEVFYFEKGTATVYTMQGDAKVHSLD